MSEPATINPRLVEALYCEALVLSDEVRAAFTMAGPMSSRFAPMREDEDLARIALSSEGLRTTTRMMHAVAWLLNHRAYFMGEISEFQLRRHGRLSPATRPRDASQFDLLGREVQDLIETTERFYERLLWLDRSWRRTEEAGPSAIDRLRERLERRLAG